MFGKLRKFVAVLMLLWLPLFGTSAVAASVSMQMQHGTCRDAELPNLHGDADVHQHHHADDGMDQQNQIAEDEGTHCDSCGVCHFACSSYLAAPIVVSPGIPASGQSATPYLVFYASVISVPLLPPPLACV